MFESLGVKGMKWWEKVLVISLIGLLIFAYTICWPFRQIFKNLR